jgi:hypothetical protein
MGEGAVKRAAWLVALCPLLVGCGTVDPIDGRLVDLEANQSRWDSLGPDTYVYAIERLCFCGVEYRGPVRVRVVGGTAVERVYVDTGSAVPPGIAGEFPTVEGLFELIGAAFESDAHQVDVTYDPAFGVPLDLWIDYDERVADEELGMQVTEAVTPGP